MLFFGTSSDSNHIHTLDFVNRAFVQVWNLFFLWIVSTLLWFFVSVYTINLLRVGIICLPYQLRVCCVHSQLYPELEVFFLNICYSEFELRFW